MVPSCPVRRALPIWIALVIGVLTGWTWETVGDCDTGWEWSRKFVGCIQSNCSSVQHAHYGYDGTCVCSSSGSIAEKSTDPTKACKRAATHASCPRCVYACVEPTEACPGEKPKPDPKQACEDKCTEYHSPGVQAKLIGGKCNCVCKKGYAPDETLTCRKVECSEQCKDELGSLGQAKGTHPDCNCACQDGFERAGDKCLPRLDPSAPPPDDPPDLPTPREPPTLTCPPGASPDPSGNKCECGPGFLPEPKEGKCVKPAGCGDATCDSDGEETCVTCPEDCGCADDEFCTGPEDDLSKAQCRKHRATVVAWGCGEGTGVVGLRIKRDGERIAPRAGLILTDGDQIRLSNDNLGTCKDAFVTLDWGGTLGRVILGEGYWYDFEIKGGAWKSGWPVGHRDAREVGSAIVSFVRDHAYGAALTFIFGEMLGGAMAASSPGGVANRHVWINSYVVIHQRTDGSVRVYTKEGAPEVSLGEGPRVAVAAGMAVDFEADGTIAAPTKYDPAELDALGEDAVPWCGAGQHREGARCVDDAPAADGPAAIEPTTSEAKRGRSRLPAVIGWIAVGLIGISGLGLLLTIARRRED